MYFSRSTCFMMIPKTIRQHGRNVFFSKSNFKIPNDIECGYGKKKKKNIKYIDIMYII